MINKDLFYIKEQVFFADIDWRNIKEIISKIRIFYGRSMCNRIFDYELHDFFIFCYANKKISCGDNISETYIVKGHFMGNKKSKKIENDKLHRSLKSRHMSMIAIGASIGTGLFLTSGSTFSSAGPGGAVAAFIVMGVLVYFIIASLGEMSTLLPVAGSFETFASRFVDPAFGFAVGWNYWFSWAITLAVEISAATIIIQYWLPDTNVEIWAAGFLIFLFLLNYAPAKIFGESEYWFAGIKVVTVIIFLIIGVLMIAGILGGTSPGISNWVLEDGNGNKAPFIGGFGMMLAAFLSAGFSFSGVEMVALAAGEAEDPKKTVPRAVKNVFSRIMIFYLGTIIVIGFLIPFTNPNLLGSNDNDVTMSPFTMIFERAGIAGAASIMNAIILTSVLSCGASSLYGSSRMLYSMAKENKAPKIFAKTNKKGVPTNAVIVTALIASSVFLSSIVGTGRIYFALYNISAITAFIIWLGIAIAHYRFRKAYVIQGRDLNDLPYKAKLFPFGPIVATILSIVIIFGANYTFLLPENFNWFDVITSYGTIPIFIGIYLWYKIKHKTKIIPLKDCDFDVEH